MTEHIPVQSSTIKSIGYDKNNKELHVDFHKSGKYIYSNVQPQTYQAFMDSDSKGKFVGQYVKGYHPHKKA